MQTKQASPTSVFPNIDVPVPYRLTPLARAALANGVSFDDVQAYVTGQRVERDAEYCEAVWYEACNVPAIKHTQALAQHVGDMCLDTILEGALLRSVLAKGTIEHARLWWGGVL